MLKKPLDCIGCPLYEKPHGKTWGFSVPDGNGSSGVCVVAEALGETEEQEGRPLIGKSGHALFQELLRADIVREDLTILNVLSCRPPNNDLRGMPWEKEAISHCSRYLDKNIADAQKVAKAAGKTFVIVTLGVIPFRRILGLDPKKDANLLKLDYYAYPFWSDQYQAWVLNAPHPAYLVRGKTHLWPVVRFVFARALEIANKGMVLADGRDYLLDPRPHVFSSYVVGYLNSLEQTPDNPLSYDIETLYKKKKSDEDELGKEDDDDADETHTILRISFCYCHNGQFHTVSIKWSAEYMADIERLFALAPYVLGWNSDKYDYPRVSRYLPIHGLSIDGMVAWHILQTSMDKALGFVTPFYWQNTAMWKHLSDAEPAFYNAKDAHAALINYRGIKADLEQNNLWHVYERHWLELSKALKYMSGKGVLRDEVMRQDAEHTMSIRLAELDKLMNEIVPLEAKEFKIYKKIPKVIDPDMFEVIREFPVKYCGTCGIHNPERWKKHATLCGGPVTPLTEPFSVWAKAKPFKLSKKSMMAYQKLRKHMPIRTPKEKKITFNADAITMLASRYKTDALYPQILEQRKYSKLLGTYVGRTSESGKVVGGMPVGPDRRIHTVYGRNASTLRYTSEDPNLQNLPRANPKDPNDPVNIIRNLIIAATGQVLYARDFSGIEAVLVGYFGGDPDYVRLSRRDVHTYYTVYALYELEGGARVKSADLPQLSWDDDRLFSYLAQLKTEFKTERNNLYKHLVHAANFMQGAKGAQAKIYSETGIEYPVATVKRVMDVYYELFPTIRRWHKQVLGEADRDGYLRNPFGYVHNFNRVYEWKKEYGDWIKKPGPDANAAIAFKAQSTAVAIITEAILRLFYNRFDEAGQYLRLQIHDELFFELPEDLLSQVDLVVQEEMERPIPELKLPASWGMGEYLSILTEAKAGQRWGSMKGYGH